jgi:predicted dehydrogenase
MSDIIPIAIIGDGLHARALKDHAAPLGRFSIRSDWREPDVRAVAALGAPGAQANDIAAALRGSRVVLCPPPPDRDVANLARLKGEKLIVAGEIAYSEAGARAIEMIRAAEFGPLRSLYLAIRQPRAHAGGDVLDDLGWEALDFVLSVAQPQRVHATTATLFGGRTHDSAVILMRTEDAAVITIELSRCLPPTLPASGLGEVEIEAMGAHQSIHLQPQATSVSVYRDAGVSSAPWLDAPIIRMLRTVAAVVDGATPEDPLPRQQAALATMTAIRASLNATDAVTL